MVDLPNMKADLNKSAADRKWHLSKHVTSNRKPQLFILKSLFSSIEVFLITGMMFDATSHHNFFYNSFFCPESCLMEKKGDIRNYHQAKITTNNVLFTLAGPNLFENKKILVHLFIMSQKTKKLPCLWQERLFSFISRNGVVFNCCISLSWCKMLKNLSRFPL